MSINLLNLIGNLVYTNSAGDRNIINFYAELESDTDMDEYCIELSNSIKAKYGKYCDNFIIKSNAIGSTNTSKYISFNVATVNDDKYIAFINKKNLKRHTLVLYCDHAIMCHVIGKGGKNLEYIKLNLVHNHGTSDNIHVLIKSYPERRLKR